MPQLNAMQMVGLFESLVRGVEEIRKSSGDCTPELIESVKNNVKKAYEEHGRGFLNYLQFRLDDEIVIEDTYDDKDTMFLNDRSLKTETDRLLLMLKIKKSGFDALSYLMYVANAREQLAKKVEFAKKVGYEDPEDHADWNVWFSEIKQTCRHLLNTYPTAFPAMLLTHLNTVQRRMLCAPFQGISGVAEDNTDTLEADKLMERVDSYSKAPGVGYMMGMLSPFLAQATIGLANRFPTNLNTGSVRTVPL